MNKFRFFIALAVIGLMAFSAFAITWRMADDQPAGYPTVLADQFFANVVNQMTNGKINIVVYYGAQLGSEESIVQQVISGAIQLERLNAAPLGSYAPEMNILSLPYLFSNSDQEWKVLYGPIGQKLLTDLQSIGLMGLTYYDSGERSFFTRKTPILTPSDVKGLKIRVQQSPVFIDLIKDLNGAAVPMAYGDVYTALQTGVIDGAENNIPSYYTMSFYQVAPYFSFDDHSRVPEVVIMNLSAWKSLTPEEQEIFKTAAMAASLYERELWDQLTKQDMALLEKAGVHFYYPTQEDIKLFQQAVAPIYQQYSQYKSIIDEIRATK